MRVICAPDKFKGSLTAIAAAEAMRRGVLRACPDAAVDLCPVADGGEGTVAALLAATGGQAIVTRVAGPLGDGVDATWGMTGDGVAVIEMAAASGLALVPHSRRDPTRTTTYGTGQLIAAAMQRSARDILVGIGGSATCDGGCGAAQAMGVRFFDRQNHLIETPITGGMLGDITRIEIGEPIRRLRVACDVTNPLTGPDGAAVVYGPQKGATPAQVRMLDQNLRHLAAMIRTHLRTDVEQLPGGGAAGGLGAGMVAFLGSELRPGIDLVLDAVRFDERVRDCDLCLTGEGRLDAQTASGKAVMGVARAAARHSVRAIALAGLVEEGAAKLLETGLSQYHAIGAGLSVDESMRRAAELLEEKTMQVVRGVT